MIRQHTQLFEAGTSAIDITPPLGTLMNGDFLPRYARFIHDPLFAKVLVCKNQTTTIVIVVVDICAMQKDLVDRIKKEIVTQSGIPENNILISSTHTHAAGSVTDLLLSPVDFPYWKRLPGLIVKAVIQAIKEMQPAQIAFGSVDAPEHIVCRRYFMKNGYIASNPVTGGKDGVKTNPFNDEKNIERPVAIMDTALSYLAVKSLAGKWISILANYSLHYVGDWENHVITADYFGVFSRQLKLLLHAPGNFVGIMSNGTSGEANTWDFMHPGRYPAAHHAKSEMIGTDLAQKLVQSTDNLEWDTEPVLDVRYYEMPIATRKPLEDEVQLARRLLSETIYENLKIINEENIRRIYAREQVLLHEFPDTVLFPVQALKIGKGVIGGLGGEFFAETGLLLKKSSGKSPYFTITFANDYVGYVPPEHEIERGGYETWRCRSSYLEPGAENKIRIAMQLMIRELT